MQRSGKFSSLNFVAFFCDTHFEFREKSFVKLTCKFRPKKIGLYSENVTLTIRRRNNFKTSITLTGRCVVSQVNSILQDSIESEVKRKNVSILKKKKQRSISI